MSLSDFMLLGINSFVYFATQNSNHLFGNSPNLQENLGVIVESVLDAL